MLDAKPYLDSEYWLPNIFDGVLEIYLSNDKTFIFGPFRGFPCSVKYFQNLLEIDANSKHPKHINLESRKSDPNIWSLLKIQLCDQHSHRVIVLGMKSKFRTLSDSIPRAHTENSNDDEEKPYLYFCHIFS